jgi:hypothetical protein
MGNEKKSMSGSLMKTMMAMIPPSQIESGVKMLSKGLIDYKNKFSCEPGEQSTIIILFEEEETLYATIGAITADNKITRQIETHLVSDILKTMLKSI